MADVGSRRARPKACANERSADGFKGQGASNAEDPVTTGSCLPVQRVVGRVLIEKVLRLFRKRVRGAGMIANYAWRSQARRQRLSSKDRERGARRRHELTACRKLAEPNGDAAPRQAESASCEGKFISPSNCVRSDAIRRPCCSGFLRRFAHCNDQKEFHSRYKGKVRWRQTRRKSSHACSGRLTAPRKPLGSR